MDGIGERVDQADGDRLDVFGEQGGDLGLYVFDVERALDAALGVDAFVDGASQIALDEGLGFFPRHVVEPGHAQRAQLEHITKALGRDQADARAFLFENGIGGDRRAVADLVDVAARQFRFREHFGQAIDDRLRIVADAGRDFLGVNDAVAAQQHDVGKSAADIDADAKGGFGGRHVGYSAAALIGSGSCHWTLGTSLQPRDRRISAWRFSVAARSTCQRVVSITTP